MLFSGGGFLGKGKDFAFCERCGSKLRGDKVVWLALDQSTGTYTDQDVPNEFNQGAFAFGKDCAKKELEEDKLERQKQEKNMLPILESDEKLRQKMNEFQEKVYNWIKQYPNRTTEDIYADRQFLFQEAAVSKTVTFLMLNHWITRDLKNYSLKVRD